MAELILNNVSKHYGSSAAVRQLSLTLPKGEFIALLGPSGCGKTTTLRMLAGFETLTEGEILRDGHCLARPGWQVPTEARNIGMVFQSYALWPHMSVAENVGYPLRHRGIRGQDYQRRVQEALAIVQLESLAERMPQDLSGGQRQRVALARCLVTEPDVVLLDEPLANLDRHLRASMEESFREFHQRTGATLVYVTHDQSEAMSLADHIAVMQQGELVQWATPETLYQHPRTEWIASFIGQGSILQVPAIPAGQQLSGEDLRQLSRGIASGKSALDKNHSDKTTAVLIRPEHIRLHTSDTLLNDLSTDNSLQGRVQRSVFRGERHEIALQLDNGSLLTAYHHQAIAPGSQVLLQVLQGWSLESAA